MTRERHLTDEEKAQRERAAHAAAAVPRSPTLQEELAAFVILLDEELDLDSEWEPEEAVGEYLAATLNGIWEEARRLRDVVRNHDYYLPRET